jgi:uncharacterized protein YbaA (DUF1428 family)
MSNEDTIQLELSVDPDTGFIAGVIASYSADDYDKFIVKHYSDFNRIGAIKRAENIADDIKTELSAFGALVDAKLGRVSHKLLDAQRAMIDMQEDFGSGRLHRTDRNETSRPFDPRAYMSGGEFAEVAQVTISLAGVGVVTGVLGRDLLRAVKDVILKWLEQRGTRSVTLKLGSADSITIKGSVNADEIERVIEAIRKAKRDEQARARKPR